MLALASNGQTGSSNPLTPTHRQNSTTVVSDTLSSLNFPHSFTQLVSDRALIDSYQQRHYQVEASTEPIPVRLTATRIREGPPVRVLRSPFPADMTSLEPFVPLPGFRAPIADTESPVMRSPIKHLNKAELQAAQLIKERLAEEGLLITLARTIQIFNPAVVVTNLPDFHRSLVAAGYPVDLLENFPIIPGPTNATEAAAFEWISKVANRLMQGGNFDAVLDELKTVPFSFVRVRDNFRISAELGETPVTLLRMQVGGGYLNGIMPGASLDMINQVARALPEADFIISLPAENLSPFEWLVRNNWPMRRPGQVTLIGEQFLIGAWAQDNGKGGTLEGDSSSKRIPGTLMPRYACVGEIQSSFHPGESLLMRGLALAGHPIRRSSLLFQGGNLTAVRDPKTKERLLLLGEAEIWRNLSLGLTKEQIVEAFRCEFGVDRCEVIPVVSYHIDFDLSARMHQDELVLFVNDPVPPARQIVTLGIEALQRSGQFKTNIAAEALKAVADGNPDGIVQVGAWVRGLIGPKIKFPAAVANAFVKDPTDSGAGNLQCFFLALDLLESAGLKENRGSPERREYLDALGRIELNRQRQLKTLSRFGWKIVPVPSMPDLYRNINFLNGIHHPAGYLIPVMGGFYQPVDTTAMGVFRSILGSTVSITPIRSSESQRFHGGVHCAASVYTEPRSSF